MSVTPRLVSAFVLSVLVHMAAGVYLDHTPWAPQADIQGLPAEQLMQVEVIPDLSSFFNEPETGGDPLVREDALRRTLQEQVDQAPKVPEVQRQEWFSPETVAVEAPREDLVARADTDLSNLEGNPESNAISSEIIKVPEPQVEAPEPDTRVWMPEETASLPAGLSREASPVPPPDRAELGIPELVPPPPLALPPAADLEEAQPASPPPPLLELPKQMLAAAPEPLRDLPPPLPEDHAEFRSWDDFVDVSLQTYRPEAKRPGFFKVVLTPNEKARDLASMAKDVLFAIDASGSMEGAAFNGMKKALADSLSKLGKDDRFNVLAFRADVMALNQGLWPVTDESLKEAREFIQGLEPAGKTDVYRSLSSVVRALPQGDRPFAIVVLTDGRSTVGLQDSRDIINALSVENRLRAAIHVFGFGSAVNHYLLGLLAYRNKGVAVYPISDEAVPGQLTSLLESMSDPILTDVRVDLSGMTEEETYPLVLQDLHRGARLEFYGRFDREKEIAMRVTGAVRGKLKEFVYRGDLPDPKSSNASIAEAWAASKAFNLVSENSEHGDSEDRQETLRELVRTYKLGIPTR
jgi:hypothetical protein